ncbi:amino acid ABC transporter permease [Sinorhizobium meliloti]|uniref:amino acid ABC transporter permease n=1 Tax=Rhizobium meliloti TaxID=382 RepID=UPI003D6627ED
MQFDFGFLVTMMPALAEAVVANATIAAIALALSLLIGMALTIVRTKKIRPVNAVIDLVISFVRGTPLMVQVLLAYYTLPLSTLSSGPMIAGTIALAINSSIYVTEALRAGLQAVDPGQVEAGTALGLKRGTIWRKVLIPQLLYNSVPVITNEATFVVKGTALLSVITVVEVMRTSQQIGSANYQPFEAVVGAAFCFFVMNTLVIAIGNLAERHLRRRDER